MTAATAPTAAPATAVAETAATVAAVAQPALAEAVEETAAVAAFAWAAISVARFFISCTEGAVGMAGICQQLATTLQRRCDLQELSAPSWWPKINPSTAQRNPREPTTVP